MVRFAMTGSKSCHRKCRSLSLFQEAQVLWCFGVWISSLSEGTASYQQQVDMTLKLTLPYSRARGLALPILYYSFTQCPILKGFLLTSNSFLLHLSLQKLSALVHILIRLTHRPSCQHLSCITIDYDMAYFPSFLIIASTEG